MAAPSIITETDNMSTTLTNSSATESPLSASQGSTRTSVTNSPVLETHLLQHHHHRQQQGTQQNNDEEASGWPRIAKLMADKPPFESYSRFRELNVKNLLYYQVELSILRDDLTKLENKDRDKRGLDAEKFAKRADYLVLSEILNPRDREQWKVALKIRRLLKHYNAALLQHTQISALPDPDSSNVEELRKWIKRPELGNYCIGGKGSDAWGNLLDPVKLPDPLMQRVLQLLRSIFWPQSVQAKKLDLVSTLPDRKIDGLTRWVLYEWIPFYQAWQNPTTPASHNDLEKNERSDMFEYSGAAMVRFTSQVATVFACILPTIAIGILTTAHTTLHILLYIGGFTALFSICLMIFTPPDTTKIQIFTATAAFSAVLVVFVQNQ